MIYLNTQTSLAQTIEHFSVLAKDYINDADNDDEKYYSIEDEYYVPDDGTGLNAPNYTFPSNILSNGPYNKKEEFLITVLYFGSSSEFYSRKDIQAWTTPQKPPQKNSPDDNSLDSFSKHTPEMLPQFTDRVQFQFLTDSTDLESNLRKKNTSHKSSSLHLDENQDANTHERNRQELRAMDQMIDFLYSSKSINERFLTDESLAQTSTSDKTLQSTKARNIVIIWNFLSWLQQCGVKEIVQNTATRDTQTNTGKTGIPRKYYFEFWNAQTLDTAFSLIADCIYKARGTILLGDDCSYGTAETSIEDLEQREVEWDNRRREWVKACMEHMDKPDSANGFPTSPSLPSDWENTKFTKLDKDDYQEAAHTSRGHDDYGFANSYQDMFTKKTKKAEHTQNRRASQEIEYIPVPALKYKQYVNLFNQNNVAVEQVIPKVALGSVLRQWFEIKTEIPI